MGKENPTRKLGWHNSQWLEMVEMEDDAAVYENNDPYAAQYMQDADILDPPEL